MWARRRNTNHLMWDHLLQRLPGHLVVVGYYLQRAHIPSRLQASNLAATNYSMMHPLHTGSLIIVASLVQNESLMMNSA